MIYYVIGLGMETAMFQQAALNVLLIFLLRPRETRRKGSDSFWIGAFLFVPVALRIRNFIVQTLCPATSMYP